MDTSRDSSVADGDLEPESPRHRAADHNDATEKILSDASRRDDQADGRDAVSDERERSADRAAFTTTDGKYTGHAERRAAALDRADSKSDRKLSAEDRVQLTRELSSDDDPAHS
jgi:hypothetical protein